MSTVEFLKPVATSFCNRKARSAVLTDNGARFSEGGVDGARGRRICDYFGGPTRSRRHRHSRARSRPQTLSEAGLDSLVGNRIAFNVADAKYFLAALSWRTAGRSERSRIWRRGNVALHRAADETVE